MNNEELELFTTEQLIEELINRTTFVGIIIKCTQELKNVDDILLNWEIFSKSVTPQNTKLLLSAIVDQIAENENS